LEGDPMAILKSEVVPKNSGAAFELKKGQRLRIAGKSIVDFVAFNLHDLTERFDQARTKTNQVKIFISTGDVLYSKRNNPMLTIIEDTFTEGRHDLTFQDSHPVSFSHACQRLDFSTTIGRESNEKGEG
jgi:uncharacterized protein YcgI (DUF1989 family)